MASFYGPTSPGGANDGDTWTNSTTGETRIYSGGTWRAATPGGAGPALERRNPAGDSTAGVITYTPAMLLGGLLLRNPNGAGRSDVTPTAAQLVAAIPGVRVNDVFQCAIINTAGAAETITVTAGVGITLIPAVIALAQNKNAFLIVRFTNVTPGAEAVIIYAVVSA